MQAGFRAGRRRKLACCAGWGRDINCSLVVSTNPEITPGGKLLAAGLLAAAGWLLVNMEACSSTTSTAAAQPAPNHSASTAPAVAAAVPAADNNAAALAFQKDVQPLLQKYCYECHGNGNSKGGVSLDSYKSVAEIKKDADTWGNLLKLVHTRQMPPSEAKLLPTEPERDRIVSWVESTLYNFDPGHPDPGRVTIHRLNRTEYNNTIRDLTGVDFQPADDFPADNSGYGFDNIGDVLSLPPVLMEKYLAAAKKIMDRAIPAAEPTPTVTHHFPANFMEMGFNADGDRGDGWMPLSALEEDCLGTNINSSGGDYILRVQAYNGGRGKSIVLTCMLDNSLITTWDVAGTQAEPGVYEARFGVPPGVHRFVILNHRIRGDDNELHVENGRIGTKQAGNIWVKWVEVEGPMPNAVTRQTADKLQVTGVGKFDADGERILEKNGSVTTKITVPKDGEYILRAQAHAAQAGDDYAKMQFSVDGQPVQTFDVIASSKLVPLKGQQVFSIVHFDAEPRVYAYRAKLAPGEHTFSAAFINEFADPENDNPNLRVRQLTISHLEVSALGEPAPLPAMPTTMRQLFATAPTPDNAQKVARDIITQFTTRAWRHPAAAADVDDLMGLFNMAQKDGQSFNESLKLPLTAVLVSPYFLFRGEIQPEPDNPASIHPVDEFALASRLSYFLWSSMPDDELLKLAAAGQLRQNLDAQVQRMLSDPKAHALVQNFAGQWLEIRNLKFVAPDHDLYPGFDDQLRTAMQTETEMFFESIMREDHSVMDFIDGQYTFVNDRLAQFYGIPNVDGDEFRKVSLAGTPRRGLLTQASILTVTSNPTRTSPVKRGKWVLEELLGTPPPPPPPDVPPLKSDSQPVAASLRAQMEEHRANPVCASCHARMDPIGFSLENFDGIGTFREKDGDFAIDPSGQLVTGENFQGPAELAKILATTKKDEFIHCLAEKMLTYALGRGLEYYDRTATDQIVQDVEKHQDKFSSLILAVVNSAPFQQRRGETAVAAAN